MKKLFLLLIVIGITLPAAAQYIIFPDSNFGIGLSAMPTIFLDGDIYVCHDAVFRFIGKNYSGYYYTGMQMEIGGNIYPRNDNQTLFYFYLQYMNYLYDSINWYSSGGVGPMYVYDRLMVYVTIGSGYDFLVSRRIIITPEIRFQYPLYGGNDLWFPPLFSWRSVLAVRVSATFFF